MAHVWETGAKLLDIRPAEGADAKELDVVRDQHDIPGGPGGVHRSGGVGHHQGLHAQQPGHPDGIGGVHKGPALVSVEAALHDGHVLPRQLPEEELALMAGGGRVLHVGYLRVGHGHGILHLVRQGSQAGAQDQQHVGLESIQFFPEGLGALLILLIGIKFHVVPP